MIKKLLLPFFLVLVQITAFGANISSTSTGGNWSASSTWVGGVVPASTDNVTIVSGSTVTLDVTPIYANTITISGTLDLNKNADIYLYSSLIVVTSPNGHINFDHSVLRLPSNVALYLQNGSASLNGSCNNNDEIFVGATQYAVCVGGGALYLFDQIETAGGINVVTTGAIGTSQIICSGVTPSTLTSTTPGTGSGTITYEWQTNASGSYVTIGSETAATYSPPALSSTTSYKRRTKSVVQGTTFYSAYTTAVTITVNTFPNNISNGFIASTICTGGSPQLIYDADDTTFTTPYSITYKNDTTLQQFTVSIPTASPYSFTPGDSPTSNTGYTIVSISNATCTRTSGIINAGANLIVRPMANATISGSTTVCAGASSPNITFTNPRTVAITVIYNINGGSNQTVNISASSNVNVPVATTATGIFLYNLVSATYQSTPNCSSTISGSATVTVNPNLPASASIVASPLGAICSGTLVTFTATPINGGANPTYQWYNGVTIISGATSSTYTSSTLVNSDAIKVIMTSNATCVTASPATSNTLIMTVNPNSPASVSIVASPLGAICSGTSVTFTAAPINGGTTPTYQWYNGATLISGAVSSTYTSSTLSNGDAIKVIMTSNTTCAITNPATSNIVTMTVPAAAIWNGSWTNGPPTSAQALIFNGSYTIAGDMEACSCQVNSGNVTVNSGVTLKITNGVTISSGSLNFNNNASLVQINNSATNIGNINYNRITPAIINTDYVYWSSPVSGSTLGALSPNTLAGKMYSYDAFASPEDWRQESSGTVMAPGKGYIVRGPEYAPPLPPFPSPFSATFVGIPNNGIIKIPIGGVNTSNLIGNPYPSALDADLFLSANSAVLEGTIYFWTHNTAIQLASDIIDGSAGSGAYAYTSNDYASYNFTGGVGVGTPATTLGFNTSSIPSGKITSGQSFFATSVASGQVATFNNGMRVDVLGVKLDNSQFFKNASNSKSVEVIEKNRIWLNLTNTQGAFKQTLVGYISGATNDFDSGYDGESYDGNEFIDFYSVYKDKNLVIQGRALPFEDSDTISLGYRSTISGEFTINIDQVDGLFAGKAIYLKDNVTNSIHNLNESAYNFKTETGTFNDRFVLSYTNKMLATDNFDILEKGVLISNKNKEVKINSSVENINTVVIYDLLGRQIYKKANVNNKELIILNLLSAKQTVLIKVSLQGGEIIHKKMIN
ncbi:T9SS sorting signal type C domain-containing protein [Flavobacterium sp. WC2416]|uniref:T9SS sorting signal type C domain-containing protein n=1 Tax=Flavobacterium sp. WC2416 TaxID=3234141 RepID=A0AB39WDI1_9FLAO